MLKRIFFLSALLFTGNLFSQSVEWIKNATGHSAILGLENIEKQDVIAAGYVYNSMSYESTDYQSSGADDVFIARLDSSGTVIWYVQWGSPNGDDRPSDLIIDHRGKAIYVSGVISPGGKIGADNSPSLDFQEHFITKMDFNGNILWTRFPGEGTSNIKMALNENNDLLLVAGFDGQTIFSANYIRSAYIFSYDKNGNLGLSEPILGNVQDLNIAYSHQARGAMISGSFKDSLNIQNYTAFAPPENQEDVFFIRMQNFNFSNLSIGAGTQRDYIRDLIADQSFSGGFIALGAAYGDIDKIDFGNYTLPWSQNYIAHLSFVNNISEAYNIGNGYFYSNEIIFKPNNQNHPADLLVTGMYTFDASLDGGSLPLQFSNEFFVAEIDAARTINWYLTGNGAMNDIGTSLCANANGDVFVAGYFGDTMTIDNKQIAVPQFTIDFFLIKLGENASSTNDIGLENASIQVFPNPTHDQAIINWNDEKASFQTFRLIDLSGKQIRSELIVGNTHNINKETLSTGLYFWQLSGEDGSVTGKIIFE